MPQNRVYLGEDGFIHDDHVGDQDHESVTRVMDESVQIAAKLRETGRPVFVVADISRMGSSSPGSRRAARDALDLQVYDKCAITGGSLFLRHLSNFISMASKRSADIRWVATQEDAAAWLRPHP